MTEQWSNEVTAFARAFAGAALFGMPLVFTMEMWWIGKSLPISYVLALLALGVVTNVGLAHVAGFRKDNSFSMSLDQAIDAMAVGLLLAICMLLSLNQLRLTDGIEQSIGTIILLALPLGIGASTAREIFANRTDDGTDTNGNGLSAGQHLVSYIGATAIGGVFIGLSIAPTDEVTMIAAGLTAWHLFLIIALSLILTYLIVFASGFSRYRRRGAIHVSLAETLLSFIVSLMVALLLLAILERITMGDPMHEIIRQSIVLALPVSIGGAAGRLVI